MELLLSGSGWGRVLVVLTVAFPSSCSRSALPIPVPRSPPPAPDRRLSPVSQSLSLERAVKVSEGLKLDRGVGGDGC